MTFAKEEERWQAVVGHRKDADGVFFYSVETTGVYCRPSCGAREPKRENVRFWESTAAAERAGFRACKRCRPDRVNGAGKAIEDACRKLAEDEKPDLDAIAHEAGMSRWHFQRVFKRETGVTPHAYFAAVRRKRVQGELARGASVTDAIYGAGFQSNGRFYAKADELLGMEPRAFRAGGEQVGIRFAIGECSLGSILVAASERGVCAILLGDDPDELAADLQKRFPKACFVAGDAPFEKWVARVVAFVEQPGIGLELPLEIRGTAFQERVWRALAQIPPGTRATYEEIAARIGAPRAVRAVAAACAANKLAVAIPCHRVVRKDGGISGYRWGVERKAALLEREANGRS